MTNEKLKQLIDALASIGFEILELNQKTKDQAKFDYDEVELLIVPMSSPQKKN